MNSPLENAIPTGQIWKQRFLSVATLVILSMIVWSNLPPSVQTCVLQTADQNLSPNGAYRIRFAEWIFRYAAHFGGFDSKWQMYGGQGRFNWRYIISAEYGSNDDSVEQILPLPRQSERSFIQRKFVDFKEAKFLLNIYNDRLARETYARYLARQFPEYQGRPVRTIRYTLAVQYILPPIVAVQEQRLLESKTQSEVIDAFDVTSERTRVAVDLPAAL